MSDMIRQLLHRIRNVRNTESSRTLHADDAHHLLRHVENTGLVPCGFFKPVEHDLLEKKDSGILLVAGNPLAKYQIIFCEGFPCDQSSFAHFAKNLVGNILTTTKNDLKNDSDFFVGLTCLPEFDRAGVLGKPLLRPQGYSLEEVGTCFAQAVDKLQEEATTASAAIGKKNASINNKKVLVGVVHDWGIAPGFHFANTRGFDKLVVFDVLPLVDSCTRASLPMYARVVHVIYQSCLASVFAIRKTFGWLVGDLSLGLVGSIVFGLFGRWLSPVNPILDREIGKGGSIPRSNLNSFHTYPYFAMVRESVPFSRFGYVAKILAIRIIISFF